jgi:hypothetical protein
LTKQVLEREHSIDLNPDEYRKKARTDSDFGRLSGNEQFQALIQGGRD